PLHSAILSATSVSGTASFLRGGSNYMYSSGMRPNLYVGFMQVSWRNGRQAGVSSLVHPRAHFVDAKGERLRMEVYARLRRHWRFINELELFKDVQNQKVYSVNVYARASSVDYISAVGLYHPQVVEGSLKH